jgi:hypothetical protein
MNRIFIAAMIVTLVKIGTAQAAGPFDGNYHGSASGGGCHGSLTMSVTDNKAKGSVDFGVRKGLFGGEISGDGSFAGKFPTSGLAIKGKFAGTAFSGSYPSQGTQCGVLMNMSAERG